MQVSLYPMKGLLRESSPSNTTDKPDTVDNAPSGSPIGERLAKCSSCQKELILENYKLDSDPLEEKFHQSGCEFTYSNTTGGSSLEQKRSSAIYLDYHNLTESQENIHGASKEKEQTTHDIYGPIVEQLENVASGGLKNDDFTDSCSDTENAEDIYVDRKGLVLRKGRKCRLMKSAQQKASKYDCNGCIRCNHCGLGFKHWGQDDDIVAEHIRLRPACPLQKVYLGEESTSTRVMCNDPTQTTRMQHENQISSMNVQVETQRTFLVLSLEEAKDEHKRFESFQALTCPQHLHYKALYLARNGFFWTGKDHIIECFDCSLRLWVDEDNDAVSTHRNQEPKCLQVSTPTHKSPGLLKNLWCRLTKN
ncbi:hypothetical protein Btru_033916 [Bulinus truncatus]|nr:hypothetical protein Btru_033916 [Bulinus truncatus]